MVADFEGDLIRTRIKQGMRIVEGETFEPTAPAGGRAPDRADGCE